jgi:transcriptional regulator with XRE-family HTH domain
VSLVAKNIHPVCTKLRELRRAAGVSLTQVQDRFGVNSVLLGSYERGDRNPPLSKIEEILNVYGYTLIAVPVGLDAVRLPGDMATELRIIADQMENKNALSQLSGAGAQPQ